MPKLSKRELYMRLQGEVAKNRDLIIELTEELNRHKATIRIINDAVLDLSLQEYTTNED